MRKRNKVQRLLVIMIGAAMLAGCSSSDTQQVPQDTATGGKTAQYRHRKVHRHREPMKI